MENGVRFHGIYGILQTMPEQSVIVWDLETVPDLAAAARMLGLEGKAEADILQAIGEGFPKHPLHKIVCIGALVASRQPEGWRVDALGAPHIGERPEVKLISDFIEKIGCSHNSSPSTDIASICLCSGIAQW